MNDIASAPNGSPSKVIASTLVDAPTSNAPPPQADARDFLQRVVEQILPVSGQAVASTDRVAMLIRLGEALLAHLEQFDCLPFPAGPRVPRRLTHQRPVVSLGLTRALRSERAMRMLADVYGEEATDKPKTEDFPQHLWIVPVEWASRHRAPELHLEALDDDLPMLYDAIAMLYFVSTGGSNDHAAFFEELVEVLKKKRSEDMRAFSTDPDAARPRLDERELGYLHPFAAPHYDCACCKGLQPDVEDEFAGPNDADLEFVAKRCESPAGAWPLLAMLFLKLLSSHLGCMALNTHLKETRLPRFFEPVRRLLLRIVRDGDGGLAEAASGLVEHLPKIAPFYTPDRRDILWQANAPDLPDCFNVFLLGLEAQTRADAVALFAGVDRAANGPLAGLASDVVELAREVASLLRDPLAAPALSALGLDRTSFKSLHDTLVGQRKTFPELGQGEFKLVTSDGSGRFHERCVPAADAARVFAPRMRRLIEYTHWMSEQGIDAVTRAAESPSLVLPEHAHEGNAR